MEIMCGSITSSPRGLASFWSSHFIHDLVATRLISIPGLAAERQSLKSIEAAPSRSLKSKFELQKAVYGRARRRIANVWLKEPLSEQRTRATTRSSTDRRTGDSSVTTDGAGPEL